MRQPRLKPLGKNAPPKKILRHIQELHSLQRHHDCLELCERLANKGFVQPGFLHLHGLALRACGELAPALTKVNAAHELDPQNPHYLNSLGLIFLDLKDIETAIELFKRATQLDQKLFHAWNNLGIALRTAERYNAAELAFTCAFHLDPSKSEPLLSLVDILIEVRAYDRAEEFMNRFMNGGFEETPQIQLKRLHIAARLQDMDLIEQRYRAIEKDALSTDEQAQVDNIWAFFLGMHERIDEAIAVIEPWTHRESAHKAHMQSQLGLLHADSGRLDKAIECHKELLKQTPDNTAGRYNLAMLQFRNGDLAEGNANYEARWQWKEFPTQRRVFDMPQWNGEPLKGKSILVWREQGIGDEVRFNSLVADLIGCDGEVTLEASPKLIPLFKHAFPDISVREEGPLECRGDEAYVHFDYHIPSGSLARIFRNQLSDFTKNQRPWLKRQQSLEQIVRQKAEIEEGKLLVGLCWRSSNVAASRNKYLLDVEQLAPLAELTEVEWLNVQYDAQPEEIDRLRSLGLKLHHFNDVDQKDDLVSACGLLGACDMVITVGVSVGDLCGGLGVPMVHIIRKDAEICLGTDHVPWFPSSKVFPMETYGGEVVVSDVVKRWDSLEPWLKDQDGKHASARKETHSTGLLDHALYVEDDLAISA